MQFFVLVLSVFKVSLESLVVARSVHPRVSGVLTSVSEGTAATMGSSPRERGFDGEVLLDTGEDRFIPA